MKLFLSPHNDDETLFGAFTLLREKPLVVFIFDGTRQEGVTAELRRNESRTACRILGVQCVFLGLPDTISPVLLPRAFREAWSRVILPPDLAGELVPHVYAPAYAEGGNAQHNLVHDSVLKWFPSANTTYYTTYLKHEKQRSKVGVPIENGDWVARKLNAMACYQSQIRLLSTQPHFLRDLYEYYVE